MNIVIVDDQHSARAMLRQIVQDIDPGLGVHDFREASVALKWCNENLPDLLLLDYRMPGIDGLALAKAFRQPWRNRDVPIIMITVVDDEAIQQAALDVGIVDIMVKPVRPRELRARCRNLLQLRQLSEVEKQRALSLEQQLLATMHEIEERERETLSRLARAIELRKTGTSTNLERMARIAGLIAEGLGMSEDQARVIELAAPLHDIGKIAIPDLLLMKTGLLDQDEQRRMQTHPKIGFELLRDSQNRFVQAGARIARNHHERYDGMGYPDGLAGDYIPIEARVVAVADAFEALISPRPYRPAWSIEEALNIIGDQRGKMFDPGCVQALLNNSVTLGEICK